jgi:hypothetical protein
MSAKASSRSLARWVLIVGRRYLLSGWNLPGDCSNCVAAYLAIMDFIFWLTPSFSCEASMRGVSADMAIVRLFRLTRANVAALGGGAATRHCRWPIKHAIERNDELTEGAMTDSR